MLNSRVSEEVVNAVHNCTVRLAVRQMLTEIRDINLLCLTVFSYFIFTYSLLCCRISACLTWVQYCSCLCLCEFRSAFLDVSFYISR
jgi:hypothetical protein